jgi:hypothetical protein
MENRMENFSRFPYGELSGELVRKKTEKIKTAILYTKQLFGKSFPYSSSYRGVQSTKKPYGELMVNFSVTGLPGAVRSL